MDTFKGTVKSIQSSSATTSVSATSNAAADASVSSQANLSVQQRIFKKMGDTELLKQEEAQLNNAFEERQKDTEINGRANVDADEDIDDKVVRVTSSNHN